MALVTLLGACSPSAPKERSAFDLQQEKSQDRAWRRATLAGEYERVGRKDPKWDEPARQSLDILAEIEMNDRTERERDYHRISQLADSAVRAGCDDPMVRYLQLGFGGPGTKDTNTAVQTYLKVAADLSGSGYPEIRKFYGCLRAAYGIRNWDWKGHGGEIGNLEVEARSHLVAALADKNLPPMEAGSACVDLLEQMKGWKGEFEPTYEALAAPLEKNFSGTPVPSAVKGAFYIDYAWEARGNGYANTVTADGWKLFGTRLETAAAALEKGWRMDPGDPFMPTKMLTVMVCESKRREEMEVWFVRAMKAYSNNWTACNTKLMYLEPKWGGSPEAMVEFGRECRTNEAWGWDVRLMIVDAHWAVSGYAKDRKLYLRQPEVWEEIHAAYEDYFRNNPDSVYRRNYAWYAYTCEDWAVLKHQLPFLTEDDYDYFGGKESFDAMVGEAKKH